MADWNIKPRATQCTACHAPFTPGMKGHSLLEPQEEGYQRHDLCDACFKALPEASHRFTSGAWTFTIPKATLSKQKEEPVQKETAEHLLRVLTERNYSADRGVIYVLAILLERSKQLIERRVTLNAEGFRLRLYEHRSSGDLFAIVDPALTPEDLPAVQQRVLELLEGPPQHVSTETRPKVRRCYRCHRRPHYPRSLRKFRS